eukprot:scaffold18435_cov113-Isochrysis_galbana.AAC.5
MLDLSAVPREVEHGAYMERDLPQKKSSGPCSGPPRRQHRAGKRPASTSFVLRLAMSCRGTLGWKAFMCARSSSPPFTAVTLLRKAHKEP